MKIIIRGKSEYKECNINRLGVANEGICLNNNIYHTIKENEIEAIMVIFETYKEVTLKELSDLLKSKEYMFSFCAIEIILKD